MGTGPGRGKAKRIISKNFYKPAIPRKALPLLTPVCLPFSTTKLPFTNTYLNPTEY